jgi:glycosyltransferase involved in cell wall biosynthesis
MDKLMDRVLVVIPTYKEYENLKVIIPEVFNQIKGLHVLIVDDISHDGTTELFNELKLVYGKSLHFISRRNEPSYAKSLLAGIRYGIENGYSAIIQMDADGSHAPKDIIKLLDTPGDVVIGSRYLKNSKVLNVPWRRQMYSIFGNVYISIVWRSSIRDKTNGFRLFRSEALEVLSGFNVSTLGFAVQIQTLNYLREHKRIRTKEVPIEFAFRQVGVSKFDFKKLIEAMRVTTLSR